MDHGLPVLSSNVVAFHFKGGKPQAGQEGPEHWIYAGWYRKGYIQHVQLFCLLKPPNKNNITFKSQANYFHSSTHKQIQINSCLGQNLLALQ